MSAPSVIVKIVKIASKITRAGNYFYHFGSELPERSATLNAPNPTVETNTQRVSRLGRLNGFDML